MTEQAEPDLTPMLDVVFILLIFFVVTATFISEVGIEPPQPNDNPISSEPKPAIILELRRDNRFYIANRNVDARMLESNLSRLHAERPDQPLIIKVSPQAATEYLVSAIDVADLIGIRLSLGAID